MPYAIEIAVPGETFRISTPPLPLAINGVSFAPSPISVRADSDHDHDHDGEFLVDLPADHGFVKRYLAGGVSRYQTTITLFIAAEDGAVFRRWVCALESAHFDGRCLQLRILCRVQQALRRKIPSIVASRECQHRLFDSHCRVDRSRFSKSASIVLLSGCEVHVDIPIESDWACGGELVDLATSERSDILEHWPAPTRPLVTIIRVHAPPYTAAIGHHVEVSAGCDRRVTTCRDKYQNVVNFGGFPHLPVRGTGDR